MALHRLNADPFHPVPNIEADRLLQFVPQPFHFRQKQHSRIIGLAQVGGQFPNAKSQAVFLGLRIAPEEALSLQGDQQAVDGALVQTRVLGDLRQTPFPLFCKTEQDIQCPFSGADGKFLIFHQGVSSGFTG